MTLESKGSKKNQFDTNQSLKRQLEEEMKLIQKSYKKKNTDRIFEKFNFNPLYPDTVSEPTLYDYLSQKVYNLTEVKNFELRAFMSELKISFKKNWKFMKYSLKEPSQIMLLKTPDRYKGFFYLFIYFSYYFENQV